MATIQLDRRRIYIAVFGLIILFLLLGFYHSPDYVPAEISKVRTSVSTWLKGTEPSLGDETYKDHFDSPSTPATEHVESDTHASHDAGLKDTTSNDEFYALPISGDDQFDVLPPAIASSTSASAASQTSALLPDIHDFVNVLPPVNVLATSSTTGHASPTVSQSSSKTDEPPIWADAPAPEATEGASKHAGSNTTHTTASTTDARPIWADELAQETTLVTHVSSAIAAASSVPTTSSIVEEEEEKWYLDDRSNRA